MHNEFLRRKPDKKILEISSKSMQEYGNDLSAFFLQKYVPELGKKVPVECVFQSAKTFQKGGPYKDILVELVKQKTENIQNVFVS